MTRWEDKTKKKSQKIKTQQGIETRERTRASESDGWWGLIKRYATEKTHNLETAWSCLENLKRFRKCSQKKRNRKHRCCKWADQHIVSVRKCWVKWKKSAHRRNPLAHYACYTSTRNGNTQPNTDEWTKHGRNKVGMTYKILIKTPDWGRASHRPYNGTGQRAARNRTVELISTTTWIVYRIARRHTRKDKKLKYRNKTEEYAKLKNRGSRDKSADENIELPGSLVNPPISPSNTQ